MDNKIQLTNLLANSYAPYSNYKVAALVIDKNDKRYFGVNVENASYGATICAERSAILSAITYGAKEIKELHMLNSSGKIAYPCHLCRQMMVEILPLDTKIVIYGNNETKELLLVDLVPNSFSKEDLL